MYLRSAADWKRPGLRTSRICVPNYREERTTVQQLNDLAGGAGVQQWCWEERSGTEKPSMSPLSASRLWIAGDVARRKARPAGDRKDAAVAQFRVRFRPGNATVGERSARPLCSIEINAHAHNVAMRKVV